MSVEFNLNEFIRTFRYPESIWPIDPVNIPLTLFPDDIDLLTKIKYPWELLVLLRNQLDAKITETRISSEAQIGKYVVIKGPVWIEAGAILHPFSVIIGPAYIGENTTVGNFTQIRGSFIGEGSLVGERTTIVRSIIGRGCSFHANYVGDSFLSEGVFMGGQTSTANTRVDNKPVLSLHQKQKIFTGLDKLGVIVGKNTRFAGNCVTMPGIKVGSNCLILPGCILYEDLPDDTKIEVIQNQNLQSIIT